MIWMRCWQAGCNKGLSRGCTAEGPRPLLALHCTLARATAWRKLGGCLADTVTITAPDLPGHGSAPDWFSGTDYMAQCEETVLPYLQRPTDLIGHSFGAVLALSLASAYPDRVRNLILYEPVLFAAARRDAPHSFDGMMAQTAPYVAALNAGDMVQAARLFNRVWGDGTRWDMFPDAARRYMTDRVPIIEGQDEHVMEDTRRLYSEEKLSRVYMPCLLLSGDQSPDVVHAINWLLGDKLPNANCVSIEGAGHMGPLTHPQDVAREVANFLEVTEK